MPCAALRSCEARVPPALSPWPLSLHGPSARHPALSTGCTHTLSTGESRAFSLGSYSLIGAGGRAGWGGN